MKENITGIVFAKAMIAAIAVAVAAVGLSAQMSQAQEKSQSDEDFLDISVETKKRMNAPYEKYYRQAKEASDNGKLKLVYERILQPYNGYGFTLDKGQVVRYQNDVGPQIIDTLYLARERPTLEWADNFNTAQFGSMTPYEGDIYFSNTPYVRPLLTLIKDTVDTEEIHKRYGKGCNHSFIWNTGRCTEGIWESVDPTLVNANSCNSNMYKGIYEIAGEGIARSIKTPHVFMHFQCTDFTKIPTQVTYYPNLSFGEIFKKGDYVELLAHQDLYCAVSLCPYGDQNRSDDFRKFTSYPVRLAIYEGADAPLETAPDPKRKSMEVVDFIKKGRPGMITGKIGKPQK